MLPREVAKMVDFDVNMRSLINSIKGITGVVVSSDNINFSWNENERFPAASLIKLPILREMYQRVQEGKLDLYQELTVTEEAKVGGFGILKELHSGLKVSLKDIAVLMIVLSDNTATNMLIRLLGMKEINIMCKRLGMTGTELNRMMMDYESPKRGIDNFTTPGDIAVFFQDLLANQDICDKYRNEMIDILTKQQCNNKLPSGLPTEAIIAHKTGDLAGTEHDAGILFMGNRQCVIVVLTKDLIENDQGIQLNIKIARFAYEEMLKE